jgi:hypothetical protein
MRAAFRLSGRRICFCECCRVFPQGEIRIPASKIRFREAGFPSPESCARIPGAGIAIPESHICIPE